MRKAFIQLHIAVFLAGFTGILGRLIHLNEAWIVWYRMAITAISMWLLFGLTKKLQAIAARDIVKITGVGLVAALHWLTFYGSIKYANVSVALVCFSSIGFFTALLEPLFERLRINRVEVLLGLITIGAIALIFHFDTDYQTGIIIGIISAFLGALFPIFNRQLLRRINVETLLAWQQTGGWVCLSLIMPIYLLWIPASSPWPSISDWGWLLVLSWGCSVFAFQLSAQALKKLSAFTVNLTYNLEPIYGILLAFVVYEENKYLSRWFYLGFIIILLVLLAHWYMLRRIHTRVQLK
jgi:drug/metabolite transporter (DMT)-like permease